MMLKCLFWTAYLIPLIYSFNLNPSIKQYFIKPFATLFVTSSLATNSVNQVNQFMKLKYLKTHVQLLKLMCYFASVQKPFKLQTREVLG